MKKILALFVVLLVAVMIFACGDNTDVTTTPAATTTTEATTTQATTTQATTKPTTVTTVTTKPTTVTTVTTATTVVTTPAATKGLYADLNFADGKVTDAKGNVTAEFKTNGVANPAKVEFVEVTFNGVTKRVPALNITESGSWVKCVLTTFADNVAFDTAVAQAGGWSVEAFYLNKTKSNIQGIVCVTEGNGKNGKQGWGIADNGGKPYFLTGVGSAYASTGTGSTQTNATDLVHVVGVYDATAKKNYLYIDGKLIKECAANGFASANETEKFEGFNMANVFYLGGDPTMSGTAASHTDYPASALTIVDVKLHLGALTAAEVTAAYEAHKAEFVPMVTPEGDEKVVVDLDFSKIENGIIADLSGNNNFATLTGNATVAGGKITFTETGAYLTIKNNNSINFSKTDSFKIEVTFAAAENPQEFHSWPTLISKGDKGTGWWGVWAPKDGYQWGGDMIDPADKTTNIPVGKIDTYEHTLTYIQDGKAGKAYIYFDGVLVKEAEAQNYTSQGDLFIGGGTYSGNGKFNSFGVQQFKGTISQFTITEYAEKTTDEILAENGYDINNYLKVELTPVLGAYYYSSSNNLSNLVTKESNSPNFWATKIFNNYKLPVGTVIVVKEGYQYRPEGWVELDQKNASSVRPGNVKTTVVVIDEAWQGAFNYRGFNISKIAGGAMTADDLDAFAIYVPLTTPGDPIDPEVKPVVPGKPEGGDVTVPGYENGTPIVPGTEEVPGKPEIDTTVPEYTPGTPILPGEGSGSEETETGKLYADIDFVGATMMDAYGKVNLEFVGAKSSVQMVEVTFGGVTKTVAALTLKGDSWAKGTLTQFKSNTEFDAFVEAKGGWSVEAFYLNKTKSNIQGIVCVTEGNGKNGKQGWGIADNGGKPYFLTGSGKANGNAYFSTGVGATQSSKTELVHVIGVYDTVANKNYLYINGKLIKECAATAFACANEMEAGKLVPADEKFNMFNVFYIGADPTVNKNYVADYTSSDLTVVDVKLYAGALTADEVTEAYNTATADFAK